MTETEKSFNDFVTDARGFVDPAKIQAVRLYGLDKAKEFYKNPKHEMIDYFNYVSFARFSSGIMMQEGW